MPRYIVHHEGMFFEWSTVVDAPTTMAMGEDQFRDHYRRKYGEVMMPGLDARLDRARANGTSALPNESARQLIAGNRAGPDEEEISFEDVIALVTAQEPHNG